MNCATRILPHLTARANAPAVWTAADGAVTFAEFGALAGRAQRLARENGVGAGDAVLLLASPGPVLFAHAVGLLGIGAAVVFVEPWLPVAEIEHVLGEARPRAFVGSRLAQLWALRIRAARRIPRWLHAGAIRRGAAAAFACDDLDAGAPAILTFTSGTTGRPKGIVRTHRYMWDVHEILVTNTEDAGFTGPELCIFPNLALLHLGTGRGAVLAPASWSERALRRVDALPSPLRPETLTCGPAFLRVLARVEGFTGLRAIRVGGAQTDCGIFERAFARWPDAQFTHVYGGTEAEPVALSDARDAVARSRARQLFQALSLGRPIPEIRARIGEPGMPEPAAGELWVSGPNVAGPYLGAPEENARVKRTDDSGTRWHRMGDRVKRDPDGGLWYGGRVAQPAEEFELEQRVYARIGTSACFVHRGGDGALVLYGEVPPPDAGHVRAAFPEIASVRHVRIVRDRRHRARIDRRATLARAGVRG